MRRRCASGSPGSRAGCWWSATATPWRPCWRRWGAAAAGLVRDQLRAAAGFQARCLAGPAAPALRRARPGAGDRLSLSQRRGPRRLRANEARGWRTAATAFTTRYPSRRHQGGRPCQGGPVCVPPVSSPSPWACWPCKPALQASTCAPAPRRDYRAMRCVTASCRSSLSSSVSCSSASRRRSTRASSGRRCRRAGSCRAWSTVSSTSPSRWASTRNARRACCKACRSGTPRTPGCPCAPIDPKDKSLRLAARIGSPQHADHAAAGYARVVGATTYEELGRTLSMNMVDAVVLPQPLYEAMLAHWPPGVIVTPGARASVGLLPECRRPPAPGRAAQPGHRAVP
jgi:hypothetical protein